MRDIQASIDDLIAKRDKLSKVRDKFKPTLVRRGEAMKGDKTMSGWVIALIVIAAVIVGLFLLTFLIYFFNLDMKLMAAMEPIFLKHYDKIERDEHL